MKEKSTTVEHKEGTQAQAVQPRFIRYDLTGPDGKTRKGWEMWLGERCFGRADDKQLLLTSLDRIQNPPRSHHWRERQFAGRSSRQEGRLANRPST